jgi:hypothetical protein
MVTKQKKIGIVLEDMFETTLIGARKLNGWNVDMKYFSFYACHYS